MCFLYIWKSEKCLWSYENAGHALESFVFHKKIEVLGLLVQLAGALAVAEKSYQFEH